MVAPTGTGVSPAGRPPDLAPISQFPAPAIAQSVQKFPENEAPGMTFTWNIVSAADAFMPWGRNVALRDKQLRDFWPTEPYLAGAQVNVSFRNAVFQWEIKSTERVAQAVTDMLNTAIAGDSFGWVPFMQKFSQDLYTQDNGAFVELIRDPGMDGNTRFGGPMAPVLGIAHLDSNRCVRTGNPEYPVVYTDRQSERHKLRWWEVIPFADYPSAIETMNGVGYCAVTRVLRMAQIAKSVSIYRDEKVSGRHFKQIHFVSGVSRQDIKDEMVRGQEEANSSGLIRFIMPSILASLDPEKPVSTATIDLASLPDGFNFDEDMKWYISCLALGYGVDYQEFAPLPGGNIGSSMQSMILHRKGSGKGPAVLMRILADAFRNYGVLPRSADMRFNDRDEQEELERQTVRTKAMEEMAIAINSHALTPKAAAESMVRRGIWDEKDIVGIPETYWKMVEENQTFRVSETNAELPGIAYGQPVGQPVGNRGGNTILEDAGRQNTGATNLTVGDRLRKAYETYTVAIQRISQQEHETNTVTAITKALGQALVEFQKEQAAIIVNVPEQPRPITNVNVKLPKVVQAIQEVVRDPQGNIEYTVTKNTYEE